MTGRMVMDYPVTLDVLPDVEREGRKVLKAAGLSFEDALTIAKAAARVSPNAPASA